tara:strand:+ start:930 stop:1211 length:282 start_codon:yes stop_codon:yes gene_type:complete
MEPIEFRDNSWFMKGNITLTQVPSILKLTIDYKWRDSILIDLKQVGEVDTSLIGLIFEWKKQAKKYKKSVKIKNIPTNLLSLAKLYGVEDFIS